MIRTLRRRVTDTDHEAGSVTVFVAITVLGILILCGLVVDGGAKLRAGLPGDWRIGDKTGAGELGTMNVIAVLWPPARSPLVVALYMTETRASFDDRNGGIAEIARAIPGALSGP